MAEKLTRPKTLNRKLPTHTPMRPRLVLYGWQLSYYTGKLLSYLRYKGIPFDEREVDLLTLVWRIKRETGEVVMPVLVTPEGEWLQDTSAIIDRLELQQPQPAIAPAGPVQRFASSLLEAWGDEWWVPIAMHTRWSYAENYAMFEREAGHSLMPRAPAWLQRRVVARMANSLRGYLGAVGVRAEQLPLLDGWTRQMLDLLEAHFAQHPYLLGERPSLGDFGLAGPMVAHLGRDLWPARELIAPRPQLRAWIARMTEPAPPPPPTSPGTGWLADDAIAPTLAPVLRLLLQSFVPLLAGINQQVQALRPGWPAGQPLPRALGDVAVPLGDGVFRRAAIPYTLWMAQRPLDLFAALPAGDQARVRRWLAALDGEGLLALDLPRLRRVGLRVALA